MLSRLMTRREQALLFLLAVSILVGSATLAYHARREQDRAEETIIAGNPPAATPTPATIVISAPRPPENKAETPANPPEPPTSAASAPRQRIAVAVTGAVRRPGLYRLDADTRVGDLVEAAGGAKSDADLTQIALPARLIDGTTLTIPYRADTSRETRAGFALNPPQYLAGSPPR